MLNKKEFSASLFLPLSPLLQRALKENLPNIQFSNASSPENIEFDAKTLAKFVTTNVARIRLGQLIDLILDSGLRNFALPNSEIVFDAKAQRFNSEGAQVQLTEKETALVLFMIRESRALNKAEILQMVWRYAEDTDTRTIESHVHRLNSKFEAAFGRKLIQYQNGNYSLCQSSN